MRIKSVSSLCGGEILAEPVLTEKNEILIPKGTALKEDYIPLIQSLNIETLMLEDPYEDYENPNPIICPGTMDKIVERVRKLIEGHIYHSNKSMREFEIIANDIVKEVDDMSGDVIIDMKERSSNLYEHTVMVTLLAINVARKLKMDRDKQYNIALGCLLHDIGIRYITTKYENQDWNKVDPVEVFEYKKHTIMGFSALEEEGWVPDIARKMVLSHHERMNGSGFPMRQKNRELECKIIQACDAFDCYISGMECKRMSVQNAIERITDEAGTLFEKKIVKSLLSGIAYYPVGTTIKISSGEKAVVISQTDDPKSPIVLISDDEKEKKHNLMLEKDISILHIV